MFNNPTLLILGAGSSFDIGMPLGIPLAGMIADKVNIRFEDGYRQATGDPVIMAALRRIAKERNEDANLLRQTGCEISNGIRFTKSIDSYLHKHEQNERTKICAKLAVAQIIAQQEGKTDLYVDFSNNSQTFSNEAKVLDSWLGDLFFLLQHNVTGQNLENVFNNFAVINFNYDRCLEHFLYYAILRTYNRPANYVGELLNDRLKIIHPYGKIGELQWQNSSMNIPFGTKQYDDERSLIEMAKRIKTFNEELTDNQDMAEIHELVASATRIIFAGFHFHEPNIKLLSINNRKTATLPAIFATGFRRSDTELEEIRSSITRMLGAKVAFPITIGAGLDCKRLFSQYGHAMSA